MAASQLGLVHICSIDDIFQRHLLSYVSAADLGRLECTSQPLRDQIAASSGWKVLCQRDFTSTERQERLAPVYSTGHQSFEELTACSSWKETYQKWSIWQTWTHGSVRPDHLVQAVAIYRRLKVWLRQNTLENVLQSFSPCLEPRIFARLKGHFPSSLLALYSVHGGQAPLLPRSPDTDFFAGLLGGYTCYNSFYSMRLLHAHMFGDEERLPLDNADPKPLLVAMSPGNPRTCLFVNPTHDDPEGSMVIADSATLYGPILPHQIVGHGGILSYLQTYVERLEAGYYPAIPIVPATPTSIGISLFPDAGPAVSRAVTRGIEVRASARWFPDGRPVREGLNFGYSIRIRMLAEAPENETCQLVGRHWAFTDGDGNVRRVDGEGVIGKQPLFFRENDKSGFVDLGPAGDHDRNPDSVFYYQSQSGPVSGTSPDDTKDASVEGTFSFVPGSIENPSGPMFHVRVEKFPLTISLPFY